MGGQTDEASGNRAAAGLILELETQVEDDRPIFVTGNFNHWVLQDPRFKMNRVGEHRYRVQFPEAFPLPALLEYKYVRGGWESEELDYHGNIVPNRVLENPMGIIKDFVPRWEKEIQYKEAYLPVIEVISEHFEVPQLVKTRRIAALLPYDYYETDKRYPVLYLQDGQNLFDDYAPFGNWGVDKRLAQLAGKGRKHELIVVSIDHGGKERIKEFTPSYPTRLGSGEGKKYVRFLTDTLKPFIDQRYRTIPGREHTGIGGSSMGGLISIYAGLMFPRTYGRLMVFSPSLWVAPTIHFQTMNVTRAFPTKIYLYAGAKEGANMVPNVHRFKQALEQSGVSRSLVEFYLSINPHGQHNEEQWGREFPKAIKWLFF